MFPVPVLWVLMQKRWYCVASPVHLANEGSTHVALKNENAHRVRRMTLSDGLLPLNSRGGQCWTNRWVLEYRL